MNIRIYDADALGQVPHLEDAKCFFMEAAEKVPSTEIKDAVAWTVMDGIGDEPTHFVINTLSSQLVYLRPRLVFMDHRMIILSALSDHGESGTLQVIKKFFIVIERE